MNIRTLTSVIFLAILMTGCSMNPRVIDYDPENDVMIDENGDEVQYEPTPDQVVVAEAKGVMVEVIKDEMFWDAEDDAERQQWSVFVYNRNKTDKCVGIIWRLMDFQFISEYPTTTIVLAREVLMLGTMVGKTMVIDGVTVAPPPSGYVYKMQVLAPDTEAEEGFECMFLPDDDEVVQEEDIMEHKE
jgi:hypothetical protein